MLTLFDGDRPMHRRELLRVGTLGLGGLALPTLFASASDTKKGTGPLTGKSVIFVFQQGGPSQFETFDPKRSTMGGTIPTVLPGIRFGAALPQLAKLADKFATIRSFYTGNAGHNIEPIVSRHSMKANIGVHYSRIAGATHPLTGMPTNAVLFPAATNPDLPGPNARGNLSATGPYSSTFAPFVPGGGGNLQQDMRIAMRRQRFFADRRGLLEQLDGLNRNADASGQIEAMDGLQRQAYELLLGGGVSKSLDLANEDPRTVELYDTSAFARGGNRWNKVNRGKKGYYTAQAESLGKLLLIARRLCEAGCGFVTIHAGYQGVWDMHADGNNLNMIDGMEAVGRSFDHAVSAFIKDTEARGLQDKIMLVATGEMGRTPAVNKRGGRDHWARLAPLLIYGGGVAGGQVIGESDEQGGEPNSDGYGPSHLISTILQTVLNPGELRLQSNVPPEVTKLISAPPIPLA